MQIALVVYRDTNKFRVNYNPASYAGSSYNALMAAVSNLIQHSAVLQAAREKRPELYLFDKDFNEEVILFDGFDIPNKSTVRLDFVAKVRSPTKPFVPPCAGPSGLGAANFKRSDDPSNLRTATFTASNKEAVLETCSAAAEDCIMSLETAMDPSGTYQVVQEASGTYLHRNSPGGNCDDDAESGIEEGRGSPQPCTSRQDDSDEECITPGRIRKRKVVLTYPTPLPVLSASVKKAISDGKLLASMTGFVSEHASFLESLVPDGYPSHLEYLAYCSTICRDHPELADEQEGPTTYTRITKMLSARIRYNRLRRKTPVTVGKVRGIFKKGSAVLPKNAPSEKGKKKQKKPQKSSFEGVPHEELLLKLHPNPKPKDVPVVKDVLEITFQDRRPDVEASVTGREIWTKYEAFRHHEMIIHEHHLVAEAPLEGTKSNFMVMMRLLHVMYHPDKPVDTTLCSEAVMVKLLARLEKELHPAVPDEYQKAFQIDKVDGAIPDTIDSDPLMMLIHVQKGVLHHAFLLSEGDVVSNLGRRPTACTIALTLLGSYYCFSRQYPACYKRLLQFLDYCLFGTRDFIQCSANATKNSVEFKECEENKAFVRKYNFL